jgi:hypothetical protein
MLVGAVQQLDVEIAADLAGERPPEVLDQLDVELADSVARLWNSVYRERPAAQIDNRPRERFVHRHISRSEADDPTLVTKRFRESLSKCQCDIFDRVMRVYVEVTGACHFEIKKSVAGKQVEHVIEKADARSDLGGASAIEIDSNLNIGLARCSPFLGYSGHHISFEVSKCLFDLHNGLIRMGRVGNKRSVEAIDVEIECFQHRLSN